MNRDAPITGTIKFEIEIIANDEIEYAEQLIELRDHIETYYGNQSIRVVRDDR